MVTCASFSRAVLLVLLSLVIVTSVVDSRRIDCTRFVFAPRCRGVAAKRDTMNSRTSEGSTELDSTYPESLLPQGSAKTGASEKLFRLLTQLSWAMRQPAATPTTRGKGLLLDRIMRS